MKKKVCILFFLVLALTFILAVTAQAATCSHTSSKLVVGAQPTCCTAGYKSRVCAQCDKVLCVNYSRIAPTGKHASVTSYTQTSPTCTKQGKLRLVCLSSRKTIGYSTVSALGHKTTSTVLAEPTCVSVGKVKISCTRCSFSTTTSISKEPSAHASLIPDGNGGVLGSTSSVVTATCTSPKKVTEYWPCCGLKVVTYSGKTAAHKYSVTSSTDAAGNVYTKKLCRVCGAYQESNVPAAHKSSHLCMPYASVQNKGASINGYSCSDCDYYTKNYTPYIYSSADNYSEYTGIVK